MIVLTAIFKAKQGKEKELENLLREMIPQVQNEGGTTHYILNRSAVDSGHFLFYEMYVDKDALEFHSSTPYFQALLKNIESLVSEEPQIDFYEYITSISR